MWYDLRGKGLYVINLTKECIKLLHISTPLFTRTLCHLCKNDFIKETRNSIYIERKTSSLRKVKPSTQKSR